MKDREAYYGEDGQLKPKLVREILKTRDFESRLRKAPGPKDWLGRMQDKRYAWFRRLIYKFFKLNPKER